MGCDFTAGKFNGLRGRDEALVLSLAVLLSSDRENTGVIMALLYILS